MTVIPFVGCAERDVVATVIALEHGRPHLPPHYFYDERNKRLATVAELLSPGSSERRAGEASVLADVDLRYVDRIVYDRVPMFDASRQAAVVLDTYRYREALRIAFEFTKGDRSVTRCLYEALGGLL